MKIHSSEDRSRDISAQAILLAFSRCLFGLDYSACGEFLIASHRPARNQAGGQTRRKCFAALRRVAFSIAIELLFLCVSLFELRGQFAKLGRLPEKKLSDAVDLSLSSSVAFMTMKATL
jgi:hypothetical protein